MNPRRLTLALLPLLILLAAAPTPAAVITVKKLAEKLQPAPDGSYRFGECHARLEGSLLTIGNAEIERAWAVDERGGLEALSFRDLKSGKEWLGHVQAKLVAAKKEGSAAKLTVTAGQAGATEKPSLRAVLNLKKSQWLVETHFQVFEGARGILMDCEVRPTDSMAPAALEQAGLDLRVLNGMEYIDIASKRFELIRVKFLDQTDRQAGPLVIESRGFKSDPEWSSDDLRMAKTVFNHFRGNLFFVEDTKTSAGLIFLKHAPLPDMRPMAQTQRDRKFADLVYTSDAGKEIRAFTFQGNEITSAGGESYRWVTLAYSGGRAGRIAALQQYHRQLRQYDPTRDGLLLTNTWGDRSKDGRVSDAFMRTEIEAAARMGVDVVEIDDGWQKGTTSNSVNKGGVWDNLYEKDPGFWQAHPERFPNGIKPLADFAKSKGIQFGLWFHPDSSGDFKNWEKDRQLVLDMHFNRGVNYFKFDGIKITSRACEANLHRLIDEILMDTAGRVTIDLDVTAEVRPGYFGIPNHGPLFVENRYTDNKNPEKAANSYWPWRTLRNLWLLAQYVDPVRLRMEFLNNARNTGNYGASPLAPATYDPDYLFASVMMSSPLGWFETQHLPPAYQEKVAPLVAVWKAHREAIFKGAVIPVGEAPSGKSWTGFVSVAKDRRHAYALVFREVNEQAAWSVALPLLEAGEYDVKPLAGAAGQAAVKGGTLSVELARPRAYALLEITRK